jgi:hypothetical protein
LKEIEEHANIAVTADREKKPKAWTRLETGVMSNRKKYHVR